MKAWLEVVPGQSPPPISLGDGWVMSPLARSPASLQSPAAGLLGQATWDGTAGPGQSGIGYVRRIREREKESCKQEASKHGSKQANKISWVAGGGRK